MRLKKAKIISVLLGLAVFAVQAHTVKSESACLQMMRDAVGLHGIVTSLTRFAPFESNDVLTNAERDISFEYIEITTSSKTKMRLIYKGTSEYNVGDEVCLLYKPTSYGSFFLGELLDKDDLAMKALPFSKIRVEAHGFIMHVPSGVCLLCSDEQDGVLVLSTESGKGSCKRWTDEESTVHVRIEDEKGNSAEATVQKGCATTTGSGLCSNIKYREY